MMVSAVLPLLRSYLLSAYANHLSSQFDWTGFEFCEYQMNWILEQMASVNTIIPSMILREDLRGSFPTQL